MENTNSNKYGVKVLEKALSILNCFTVQKPEWTINEFCNELALNRTTVYRIITTLKCYNYVCETANSGKYRLGKSFLALGSILINEMDLKKKAGSYLEELSSITDETVSLSIYYQYTSLIIDSYDSTNDIKVHVSIGKRAELHAASHGKILLASLCDSEIKTYLERSLMKYTDKTRTDRNEILEMIRKVKEDKIAYDLEELKDGIIGIAAPIFDYNNKIIAAISIVGPKNRVEINIKNLEKSIKNSAFLISQEMGYIVNEF